MAVLFIESFDHLANADKLQKWNSTSGSATIGAYGQNSTSGLRVNTAGIGYLQKTFTNNSNTFIGGFAFRRNSTNTDHDIFCIVDNATVHIVLYLLTDGTLRVYRGPFSTLLGTCSVTLSNGTYYYIEVKCKIDNTVGTVDVNINGSNALSLTGQDTQNTANSYWNSIYYGNAVQNASTPSIDYDDIYIADSSGSVNNNFLGPVRVVTILPDGAGNSTDFTPSTGSNFQNVDDSTSDGDSTYNSETTPGDHDTYTYGAVGVTGTVRAVQTNLLVRSNGAGSETIRPKIRIGSTDYSGTTVSVTTSYSDKTEIFETSPATATAWTTTEIDGAEFGIELVS